jgi:putative endopeptidase
MFTHQMKKIMALITVPTLIFTMAGCSSNSVATSSAASALSAAQTVTPAAAPAPASSAAESMSGKASGTGSTDGQKWIDSDVQGSVTTDTATDPTDDFVLYVNKDWDVAFNPENNSGVQILDIQRKSVRKLVTETIKSGSDGSHDAGLVSTLYNDTVNMNARNASGMKPVQKYVEAIRNTLFNGRAFRIHL